MTTKKSEQKIYDLRTIDQFISQGVLKKADYEKYLKSLPDDEANVDLVKIDEDSIED